MAANHNDTFGLADVITRADAGFLAAHDMRTGAMMLIDEAQMAKIYVAMGPVVEISRGAALPP